jgi:anaerobic selenocysteine-containing dehydrogenase
MLAALKLFGHQALFPVPDIDRTQFFLCLGGNPMASNGSLMTAAGLRHRLRELPERGGRFVVVDPLSGTAAFSGVPVQVRADSRVGAELIAGAERG